MNKLIEQALDPRQFSQWGEYMKVTGWDVERIGDVQIFIKKLPLLPGSMIKIQHPVGPIPFEKIDDLAIKYKALSVVIEPHVYKYDEKSYKKAGFRPSKLFFSSTATIKIDLTQSEQSLLKSFSENARRNIKKAQENNLIIKTVFYKDDKDNKALKQFYFLQKNLQKIKKFYAPPYEEQLKKIQAFKDTSYICFAYEGEHVTRDTAQERDSGRTSFARMTKDRDSIVSLQNDSLGESDKPIAAVWYAYHKDIVFYVQTGATQKGYATLANYLLVWEGLKIARRLGLKVFDFESIYDPRFPNESKDAKKYSEFKKRFHGEIIEYPRPWIKFYKSWFKYLYIMGNVFSK